MQRIRTQLQLIVLLGCMSTLAHAAPDCGAQFHSAAFTTDIGPRHHPIGRPLPRNAEFNQPVYCGDDIWFFDLNHNGRPEPGEPKLFGPERLIGCNSCHGDSTDAKSDAATNVGLRQAPGVLCLICHRR